MSTPDYGDHDPDAACTVCSHVDYKAMYEAERDKFQAETVTTSFLVARIRESIETFDRTALTCDRCGWRGARVVVVLASGERCLSCDNPKCIASGGVR